MLKKSKNLRKNLTSISLCVYLHAMKAKHFLLDVNIGLTTDNKIFFNF